jgi:tetratricopeptide (TPR) repeat protein
VVSIQDNRWRFAHDKLREAITADIPRETVPTIHRTAATTIETVYPDDDAYNEALFAHWQAAGDLDKTCQYLLPVARNMIEIAGTYPIAEAHLHQTLERLPKNDARCITLWNWLADSAERQNNLSASQGYALQAQELAASLDDRKGLATSLSNLGNIAMDQGEYARATDLYQQSLVIFQQLGDQLGIASSLSNLGIIAVSQGEYVRAIDRHQQSLAIRQQLGDQAGIAVSLCNLGIAAANQGEYVRATDLFQQSLVIFQQLGNQPSIASLVNNLGVVAANQWEYARATDLYQQSLAIRQQLGDQAGIAVSLINLGVSARSQGEVARATDLFQQSIVIFQQLGDQAGIAECLNELGAIARSQGEVARATDLFQQSLVIAYDIQAIRTILASIVGLAKHFFIQGHLERAAHYAGLAQSHPAKSNDVRQALAELLPQLESALTPDEFQTALERGKSLDLNTVVEELLAEFAEYSGGQGQVESAAHSTDFAQHHPPKDDNDVRDALAEVVPSLQVTLSPDERAADLESDMPLDLDTVVLEAALSPDKRAAALERDKELDLDTVVSDTVVQELLDESTPPEA